MNLHESRACNIHMCQRPLDRMRLLSHLPYDILSFIWKKIYLIGYHQEYGAIPFSRDNLVKTKGRNKMKSCSIKFLYFAMKKIVYLLLCIISI